MTVAQIGWSIAVVGFLLLEVLTPTALVSIWLMLGALAALVTTLFSPLLWVQLLVFALVSALTLLFTRPLVREKLADRFVPTNADQVVGTVATVTQDIAPGQTGRVQAGRLSWAAKADEFLPAGSQCTVLYIEGVTLYVTAVCETVSQMG